MNDEWKDVDKLNKEEFIDLIEKTSIVAWEEQIKERKILNWLSNFTGECLGDVDREHKLALWLLLNFTFYTMNDVKKLCRELFQLFLREELRTGEFEEGLDRNKKDRKDTGRYLFCPFGESKRERCQDII